MRIIIDLDGTICEIKKVNQTYDEVKLIPGALQKLRELKANNHYLIIQTARNMKTQQANLGRVVKNVGKITLDWLEKHEVPYDEIYFGKPNGDLYIDDRAWRFKNWDEITVSLITEKTKEK